MNRFPIGREDHGHFDHVSDPLNMTTMCSWNQVRTPPKKGHYLVTHVTRQIFLATYDPEEYGEHNGGWSFPDVIAWAHLPKPYMGNDDE